MPYIIGGVIVVIIVLIIYIILFINKKNLTNEVIEELKKLGKLDKSSSKAYDYLLNFDDKKVYIKLIYLKGYHTLSINSKRHWQAFKNSGHMLKTGGFENIRANKVLLVFPPPKKVIKYINENEVVFVKYDEKVFDFHLFTSKEINNILDVYA